MLETRIAAHRTGALGRRPGEQLSGGPVEIRALPPAARLSLRLRELDGAGPVAGLRLDTPINRAAVSGERAALRLGPDEWLILALDGEAETLAEEIAGALSGRFHSVLDVSHRSVGFEVSGPLAAEAVNAGCPLDLSAAAFPTGAASRTLLGKVEIVLMRTDEAPTFRLEVWRSFARHVDAYLRRAAEAARDAHRRPGR